MATIKYDTPTAKMSVRAACDRVALIYRDAEQYGHTHAQIMSQMRTLHRELSSVTASGAKRYSSITRATVSGYESALFDRVQRDCLEFVYQDKDGKTYSTHRLSAHHHSTDFFYDAGRGSELADLECTHCWKSNGKAFSEWETPRAASERAAAIAAVKADARYSVQKEFIGDLDGPQWVVRFCGDWLALTAPTEHAAYILAAKHNAERLAPFAK